MNQTDIHTHWCTASSKVGTGFDSRSSNNGLLTIMYGSLERAHHFNWLNAGRTLVDKTYIHILWQAKQLSSFGLTHHDIATQLELFIRAHLQPRWSEIKHLTPDEADQLAIDLIRLAASKLFGSCYQEEPASWLLYYLCPQLPIFPLSECFQKAITQRYAIKQVCDVPHDYEGYHRACQALYNELKPQTDCGYPTASYGNNKEQVMIEHLLRNSDWWSRHCFLHYLQFLEK